MGEQKSQGNRNFVLFLLFWSILFGSLVRIIPALGSEMPVNDGGLFYSMAEDIENQNYSLPLYASYNHAKIPFAYPPFALYFAAAASSIGSLLQVIRWSPPIVSIMIIPIIFLLGRDILKSDIKAGLATVAFAFLPASYELTITGGGLTRSLGFLFSALTLLFTYHVFHQDRPHYIFLTALSASLLVLSHPIATVHTLISCIVFWVFWGRSKNGTKKAFWVALLTLAFTSPWWVTVILRHGFAPFLHAMQTGVNNFVFFLPLLRLNLGNELFLDLITVLSLLGFCYCLIKKKYLLPIWALATFIVGRDAQTFAMIPVAFAASLGLANIVSLGIVYLEKGVLVLDDFENSIDLNFSKWFSTSKGLKVLLSFFLIYSLFNSFAYSLKGSIQVTDIEKEAIEWINHHTPNQSRFLILTFGDPLNTPFQEWFPALTKNINLTVAQGYEWLPDQQFLRRLRDYELLQPCLTQKLKCVDEWIDARGFKYDYIYVYRGYVGRENFQETEILFADLLLDNLSESTNHSLVYQTQWISIFSHQED